MRRSFRTFLLVAAIILLPKTAGATNTNGNGVSLNLSTTDLPSVIIQSNSVGARLMAAGTPAFGIVSANGAEAKVIIEPMNALTANGNSGTPAADFSATPLMGSAPLEVQFFDLSSGGLYEILSWTWDFGDGSPYSSDQDPNHSYESPGSYTVTLTLMTTGATVSTSKENYIAVTQQVPGLGVVGMLLMVVILAITGTVFIRNRRYHNGYTNCH